ncbi:MAG: hypothetical protein LAT51_09105 [Flavobacteriaceae bacterium]|nr:hypothetical protein [Flavobacteriaceae bacterium]
MKTKKLKVIAFGIGVSCKDYLSKYKDEHDIIALSDWDTATHGTQRYGYDIIDPNDFSKYDYDKILILSVYVPQIKQQLNERCGITEKDIIAPAKYKIKGVELPL